MRKNERPPKIEIFENDSNFFNHPGCSIPNFDLKLPESFQCKNVTKRSLRLVIPETCAEFDTGIVYTLL